MCRCTALLACPRPLRHRSSSSFQSRPSREVLSRRPNIAMEAAAELRTQLQAHLTMMYATVSPIPPLYSRRAHCSEDGFRLAVP